MKIPKSFKVKGREWTVVLANPPLIADDGDECNGLCDTDDRVITLCSDLSPEKRTEIFLHELMHAIIAETRVVLMPEIEDFLCNAISTELDFLFKLQWKKR